MNKDLLALKDGSINIDLLTQDEIMKLIDESQDFLMNHEQVDLPVKHHFSKDVYARELFIPKGTLIIGKIHKETNLNILSKGELTVISIEGRKRVKAPFTIVSPPGVKRMAYAHEDSIWTTIHGTSLTDVDQIEEKFIAKSYDEVPALQKEKEAVWLGDM